MDTTTQAFRAAHAGGDGGWDAIVDRTVAALGAVPEAASLGFVYVTDHIGGDLSAVVDRLRAATGVKDWVGTIGYGVCGSGHEYFDRPAISILIGALADKDYRVLPTMMRPGEPMAGDLPVWTAKARPRLGIVHADPRNAYLGGLLDSLYDDTDCFIVGGLTASRGAAYQVAGELTEGGVSGVLFGPDIGAEVGLSQGCSPISQVFQVTRCHDNVVVELDGRPAVEVFRESIGDVLARDLSRVAGYIHVALPIASDDRGDYLVRNLLGVDPRQRGILVGQRVVRGDKLMFVRRDAPSARADLLRMLDQLRSKLAAPPRAALYFSCVARGPNLFGPGSTELQTIADVLGEVPLAGFFANGEICNSRLYGYTGVLTLFS